MTDIQDLIDEYASDVGYIAQAEKFLQLERWTGDNPLLLLADAAGTTTGQTYFTQVKPSVEDFRTKLLETGRIGSFADLAELDQEDPMLAQIFQAQRKRHVLINGAEVFASIEGEDDLERLQQWARNADSANYSDDPFGQITGVGLRTFQYLRMIAGIDTVKPDIQVRRLIKALADASGDPHLDPGTDHSVLESCHWIAEETDYRMIEIDQIAWWYFADTSERHVGESSDS